MTKRFKKQPDMIVRFCLNHKTVFGCKRNEIGGKENECYRCDFTEYCVAGCHIDNIPVNLQRFATSGFCPVCRERLKKERLQKSNGREKVK